jgi:hypothetical protein
MASLATITNADRILELLESDPKLLHIVESKLEENEKQKKIESELWDLVSIGKCYEAGQLLDQSYLPENVKRDIDYHIQSTMLQADELDALNAKLKAVLAEFSEDGESWKDMPRGEGMSGADLRIAVGNRWHEFVGAMKPLERECERIHERLWSLTTDDLKAALADVNKTLGTLVKVHWDFFRKHPGFTPGALALCLIEA